MSWFRRRSSAPLWQDERYDRIPRDGREFEDTWNYIRENAVTAGLVSIQSLAPGFSFSSRMRSAFRLVMAAPAVRKRMKAKG